jgi:hypothetical protein
MPSKTNQADLFNPNSDRLITSNRPVRMAMLKPQIKKQTGRSVSVDGSSCLGLIWGVDHSKVVKLAMSNYGSAS